MDKSEMGLQRPSLRETKKRENLLRIKEAAKDSFSSRSFEDVTIREIALKANVGIGTVFRYAQNKQDLLLLTVIDDIDDTLDISESGISSKAPLLRNLMSVLEPPFVQMGNPEWPALAQVFQRELPFYETGEYAVRFRTQRHRLLGLLTKCVNIAIDDGEIAQLAITDRVIWMIFSIYHAELRHFTVEKNLNLSEGLDRLQDSLNLFIHGLGTQVKPTESRARA